MSTAGTWSSPWIDPPGAEIRQNWPGRLAWLEAQPARTPAEQDEMERLRIARERGVVVVNRLTQKVET